jgi:hypothetical protein
LDTTVDLAVALLIYYSFDLGGYTASELVELWLKGCPAIWIRQSVIEALYQGRYKAVSVEQILAFWKRRGQAVYHFNHEFERLICGGIPQRIMLDPSASSYPLVRDTALPQEPTFVAGEYMRVDRQTSDPFDEMTTDNRFISYLSEGSIAARDTETERGLIPSGMDSHRPIEQFTPVTDSSDFYTKLKAIAQVSETGLRSQ